MLLAELVEIWREVAGTASRNRKVELLAALLRRLSPEEVESGTAWLSGELRQGRIGIGPAALAELIGIPAAERPGLTLTDVGVLLERFAAVSGAGSAAHRGRILDDLAGRATAEEREFLLGLLSGGLRQGALEGVMTEAVARASGIQVRRIRRALMFSGSLPEVARAALSGGETGLKRFSIRPLSPVMPMLAQSAADLDGALGRLGRAALEWKLDGARIQAHKEGGEVRVFSRNLRDVTEAVPEIAELIRGLPARQIILDGEALALRPSGRPEPFQVTMSRFGRKLDVAAVRVQLPLAPFFFDCLYLDGEDLVEQSEEQRFQALRGALPAGALVRRIVTANREEAKAFLEEATGRGHEGLMAKDPQAPYQAGRRGAGWLKVKPATTLDLVVLAAEWGHGRRRGWLSNLHLGARDPGSGAFVMLGKTFKGMTDEMLKWQTRHLLELEVGRDAWTVYVRPELVVEVTFNEIQESPRYPAGLALRFARVKGYRTDKRAEEADTIQEVRRIFERQAGGGGSP
ncbi:MAG: ATP-dependent DNA ligase [bacterium]